jgi:hypothetical protein
MQEGSSESEDKEKKLKWQLKHAKFPEGIKQVILKEVPRDSECNNYKEK